MLILSRGNHEAVLLGQSRLLTVVSVLRQDIGMVIRDYDGVSRPLLLRINESADVGLGVTVTLVDIRNSRARLGIVAPKELSVHRKEVWDAIQPAGLDRLRTDS